MSLKGHVIRSSLWSLAGGSGQQLIAFVTFLYLAKVLDARAVGIVASAAILSDLIVIFSKLGLIEAVQKQQPDVELENAAWWFSVASGTAGSLVLILSSFLLRLTTIEPEICNVLLILSPVAMLSSVSAVPEGVIRRRLDFKALSVRTWIATLLGGLASIISVSLGLGLFALALQRLVTAVSSALMIWLQSRWRPHKLKTLGAARPLVRTGLMIVVGNFSGIVNARISDTITAIFLGPTPLGFLRLASRFSDVMVQMVVTPVVSVALPSFSRLKCDRAALRRSYLRLTQFMSAVAIPAFFGLGSVAEPFIRTILGDKWIGALIAFQLLGFSITAGAVNYFFSPLMVSIDRADIVMKQSLTQVLLGVILVWVGAQYGLIGVVCAGIVRASIVSVMNTIVIVRTLSVSVRSILFQWIPPFISSLVMFLIVSITLQFIPSWQQASRLVIGMIVGATVYGAALLFGDLAGVWKGYVRNAARSLRNGFES